MDSAVWHRLDFKLRQADSAFNRMEDAANEHEFYPSLSEFLAACRSVSQLLEYQFGYRAFVIGEKKKKSSGHLELAPSEVARRKAFDFWFKPNARAVLSHPLKEERDSDIHRDGVSSARYSSRPGPGWMSFSPGSALRPEIMLWNFAGSMALSSPRPSDFYFEFEPGTPALNVCRVYFDLVLKLVGEARAEVEKL